MRIFREKNLDTNSHVFISYSSKDSKIARQIYGELEGLGLDPWLSEIDTAPGANYAEVIPRIIEDSVAVVVLITKDSVKSDQVLRELNLSVGKKHLIPVNMSGRSDILKSERAWEYFLGIVQMFEHTDVKSTAEKILENIEYTTGKKFRVTANLHAVEPIQEESAELQPKDEIIEAEPLSTELEIKQEGSVEDIKSEEISEVQSKSILGANKKLVYASMTGLLLIIALIFSINSSEKSIVKAELINQTLSAGGVWVDNAYLESGKGNYFRIENSDLAVSGEYVGSFVTKGKKRDITREYISISVNSKGQFQGLLNDDSSLNGFVTFNSSANSDQFSITFESCTAKFDWVKSEEFCTFYRLNQ